MQKSCEILIKGLFSKGKSWFGYGSKTLVTHVYNTNIQVPPSPDSIAHNTKVFDNPIFYDNGTNH